MGELSEYNTVCINIRRNAQPFQIMDKISPAHGELPANYLSTSDKLP